MASSTPTSASSSQETTRSSSSIQVVVADADDEVQAVGAGVSSGAPELVTKSRISPDFHKHVAMLKGNICPGIFPTDKWNLGDKDFAIVNKTDLEVSWREVNKLAEKYKKKTLGQKLPFHYYLLSLILKAKIECVDSVHSTITAGDTANKRANKNKAEKLKQLRNRLVFQELMVEEMTERYVELEYLNLKEKNQKQAEATTTTTK